MSINDIFRSIRKTFNLNNSAVVETFALADLKVTEEQVSNWIKSEEEESFVKLEDRELALFLNGFINLKRGKRDGEQPKPEEQLSHNMVFQKLRIALNLKAEDILDLFYLAEVRFSKHEISAFFRKPANKHYRECTDQTLEDFLRGCSISMNTNE